jgi:hypothetical protein
MYHIPLYYQQAHNAASLKSIIVSALLAKLATSLLTVTKYTTNLAGICCNHTVNEDADNNTDPIAALLRNGAVEEAVKPTRLILGHISSVIFRSS